MRTLFGLGLALWCAAVAPAQEAEPHAPEPRGTFGAGAAVVQTEQIAPFDVLHYSLEVEFDLDRRRIDAVTKVNLRATDAALPAVSLHFGNLTLTRVADERGGGLTHSYDPATQLLTVKLAEPLPPEAETTLTFAYHGTPADGLWFIGPDAAYPDKPRQCWSQGQPESNRYWFPCWDKPNDFATVDARYTVPPGFTAVGNGRLVARTPQPDGAAHTWHWRQEHPHASYLTSVAIGEFYGEEGTAGDIPLQFYIPKDWPDPAGTIRRSFHKTGRMLAFMHDTFGVPYPSPKYAQTCVLDFLAGGMENTSATTLTALTLHDARAHLDGDSDDLVMHEIAHQWFGNLVTCRDWPHIWLNEGFATYAEALWVRHEQGEEAYRLKLRDDLGWYWWEAGGQYRRPMVTDRYAAAGELFDGHTYSKGGRVLAMLHEVMGDTAFRKASKAFLTRFRHQPATTAQFQQVCEAAHGAELGWFFDQWCRAPGHPELELVTYHDPAAQELVVTVTQAQDRSDGTPLFRFTLPLQVATGTRREVHRLEVRQATQQFRFAAPQPPDYVCADPAGLLLATISHGRPLEALLAQLRSDASPLARIEAAEELADTFTPGGPAGRTARAALGEAAGDPDKHVRRAACWALAGFGRRAVPDLLRALADTDAGVRRAAVEALAGAAFGEGDTAAAPLTKLLATDPSYRVRAACLFTLAEINADGAQAAALAALQQDSHLEAVRAAALEALFITGHPEALSRALAATAYGRPPALIRKAIGVLERQAGDERRVIERLITLTRDPSYHTRNAAIRALGTLRAPAAVGALRERVAAEADHSLRASARQALDRIARLGPRGIPEGK